MAKLLTGVLLMLLIGLQAMLWFGDHGLIQLWRMERTLQQQQTSNQGLVDRNRRLQAVAGSRATTRTQNPRLPGARNSVLR